MEGAMKLCRFCNQHPILPKRWRCCACFNEWQRSYRRGRGIIPSQRLKHRARQLANLRKAAGTLEPRPCRCGSQQVQMHHADYQQPYKVEWLCKACHREEHRDGL
jgi:hypothetical protein